MRKQYLRLTEAIKNPFFDRRTKYGISQFEEVPQGALLQFYYEPHEVEVEGKIKSFERLYSVNAVFNGSHFSVPRFEFDKKGRLDFWELLEKHSIKDEPRSAAEIHQACNEPEVYFYVDLLMKAGYSFTELLAMHEAYAELNYK